MFFMYKDFKIKNILFIIYIESRIHNKLIKNEFQDRESEYDVSPQKRTRR